MAGSIHPSAQVSEFAKEARAGRALVWAAGEAEAVRRLRDVLQTSMKTDLVEIVERLTGRQFVRS